MLRSISMCNFVHFEEPQILQFDEPVNFIIGGNSTGKSAIFELIRRCYSNKLTTTNSSILNKDKLAYVICNFEITEHYPKLKVVKKNPYRVVSFVFTNIKNSITKVQKRYWYKGVSLAYKEKKCLVTYVKEYELQGDFDSAKTTYHELKFKELRIKDIATHFSVMNNLENNVDKFFNEINNFKETDFQQGNMLSDIYEWLEKGYVGVFPMRSIGPLQWTRSSKFNFPPDEMKERNYAEACQNAEILQELLDSEKITKQIEEKYHQILVYPFTFINKKGTIMVYNALDDSDPWNILKTPEGIIEAKQLTLILAHSEFHTITIEEPDRGMHIHMVKKVRDFILKKVSGKTVIIITHNPAFMDPWSMSRSFVCSRSFSDKNVHHNVRKFPKEYTKYGRSDEEEMKSVMFSSRILFVEGIIDKMIIQSVFRLLINNDTKIIENTDENQTLQDYILSIDVHELQSATKGNAKTQLCEKLLKECFVLYDSDVFKDKSVEKSKIDAKTPFRINGEGKGVNYMESFKTKDEFLQKKNFETFASACEAKNIFVWKEGAIEYQIINVLDDTDTAVHDVIYEIVYHQSEPKPKRNGVADPIKKYIDNKDKASKGTITKGLKKNLQSANSDHIDIVANAMIQSVEVKRLIDFFYRKMKKTQTITRKRKGISKQPIEQVKRQKRKLDVPVENPQSDDEKPSTSSDEHTGLTPDISRMSLRKK